MLLLVIYARTPSFNVSHAQLLIQVISTDVSANRCDELRVKN